MLRTESYVVGLGFGLAFLKCLHSKVVIIPEPNKGHLPCLQCITVDTAQVLKHCIVLTDIHRESSP